MPPLERSSKEGQALPAPLAARPLSEVHAEVREWLLEVTSCEQVWSTALPVDVPDSDAGVGIWLKPVSLVQDDRPVAGEAARYTYSVRYLLAAVAPDADKALELVGEVVLASLAHDAYRMEDASEFLESLAAGQLGPGSGTLAGPGIWLCVPWHVYRKPPGYARVTQPLVAQAVPMQTLYGRVVGPGDLPIPRAAVRLTSLRRSVEADRRGQFVFPSVPAQPAERQLTVTAKGITQTVTVTGGSDPEDPVVIQLEIPIRNPDA